MKEIRLAIAGVGNCASEFIQDLKVEVGDSANAGGAMVAMIRDAKIVQDRGLGGLMEPLCAYYAKHPPVQFQDKKAKENLDRFIEGDEY